MQTAINWLRGGMSASRMGATSASARQRAGWLCAAMVLIPTTAELILGQHTTLGAVALLPLVLGPLVLGRRGAAAICALALATATVAGALGRITRETAAFTVVTYVAVAIIGFGFSDMTAHAADATDDSDEPDAVRVLPGPLSRVDGIRNENGGRVRVIEVRAAMLAEEAFIARASVLSERQRQVVRLAIAGLTAKQIGRMLYISERTVETHLANAYERLGVHSRSDLVSEFSRIA